MKSIKFGTDGWRDIIACNFTFFNVRIVIQGISEYLLKHYGDKAKEKGVVIGYDTRFLSKEFAFESALVFANNGIPVYFTQRETPTPVIAFTIKKLELVGGISITASHNSPKYNGIKFIPDYAGPADDKITNEIEKIINVVQIREDIEKMDFNKARETGFLNYIEPSTEYIECIKKKIDLNVMKDKDLKIVVDNMYGPGKGYIENILEDIDAEFIALHTDHNPLFGGIMPEPTSENLQEAQFMVVKEKADLAVVTDGDADRFGLISKKGKFIPPNDALALLLYHLYEHKKLKGNVVRSIATTHLLDKIANHYGFKAIETPVGFKYIADIMRKNNEVLMGGEESGGFTLRGHILEKDGIFADVLFVELYTYFNKKDLSEVIDELKQKFGYIYNKRFNLYLPDIEKEKAMEAFEEKTPLFKTANVVKKEKLGNAVRFEFDNDSWVLIRPSGTEDILRLYIEAKTEGIIGSLYEDINSFLKSLKGE